MSEQVPADSTHGILGIQTHVPVYGFGSVTIAKVGVIGVQEEGGSKTSTYPQCKVFKTSTYLQLLNLLRILK